MGVMERLFFMGKRGQTDVTPLRVGNALKEINEFHEPSVQNLDEFEAFAL